MTEMESSAIVLEGHKLDGRVLHLRRLLMEDIPQAAVLEAEAFPEDEAASEESMASRCREAGEHFWGVYDVSDGARGVLVGFVNGTRVLGDQLTEETMHGHEAQGRTLCIHSVVTKMSLRRKGVAAAALRAYIDAHKSAQFQQQTPIDLMLLISKAYLLRLYVGAGFTVYGPSPVVHGQDQWFDLGLDLAKARLIKFVQVDAFTSQAFKGNPASVVFLDDPMTEDMMQSIANEFNLAETAFLRQREHPAHYDLRWFTPKAEVDLCGHATLAAAKGLWWAGRSTTDLLHFHTRSGELTVWAESNGTISMEFPSEEVSEREEEGMRQRMADALGLQESDLIFVGANRMDMFAHVQDEAFVKICPNLAKISVFQVRGVIVTARAVNPVADGSQPQFLSRFFAPRFGIDEDPVTGSAHCALAPYWGNLLGLTEMDAYQASPRGGHLHLSLKDGRVVLNGSTVVAMSGALHC